MLLSTDEVNPTDQHQLILIYIESNSISTESSVKQRMKSPNKSSELIFQSDPMKSPQFSSS